MLHTPRARSRPAIDDWISAADNALRTLTGAHTAARPSPAPKEKPAELNAGDARLSASLMRVNHVGEICAQALYNAQLVATRSPAL